MFEGEMHKDLDSSSKDISNAQREKRGGQNDDAH